MPVPPLKEIVDKFIEELRGYISTAGAPMGSAVVRKGPQHSIKLGAGQLCAIFVRIESLSTEEPAGSGNTWYRDWKFSVVLGLPDDEADPEGCEDARMDLVQDFGNFMQQLDVRSLFGGVKVGRMEEGQFQMAAMKDDRDIWRVFIVPVVYRTLVSG